MRCLPWMCLWPPASCRVTVSAELGKRSQTDSLVSRWSTFCASSSPVCVLSCACVYVCMCARARARVHFICGVYIQGSVSYYGLENTGTFYNIKGLSCQP